MEPPFETKKALAGTECWVEHSQQHNVPERKKRPRKNFQQHAVKPQRLTENNWNPGKFRAVYQSLQKTRSSKIKTLCRNERRAGESLRQCLQNARKGNNRASPKVTHGSKRNAASNMHSDVLAATIYSPTRAPRSQLYVENVWPQKHLTAKSCGRTACR